MEVGVKASHGRGALNVAKAAGEGVELLGHVPDKLG